MRAEESRHSVEHASSSLLQTLIKQFLGRFINGLDDLISHKMKPTHHVPEMILERASSSFRNAACTAEGIPISPTCVQQAIENACKVMPNLSCSQQGQGVIQVDKALKNLQTHEDLVTEDVRFEVLLHGPAGSPQGVHVRQAEEASVRQLFGVRVNPKFK
jgi:hypothetical protein